jgi:hypothetical protein
MLSNLVILTVAAFGSSAYAAQAAYAQCGGQGFTGGTTCVSGYSCVVSNAYYSQCLPGGPTTKPATTNKPATTARTSVAPVSTSKAGGGGGGGGGGSGSGKTFKASFTQYGSGDTFGSGNCNTATTACGFYTSVRPTLGYCLNKHKANPRITARLLGRSVAERIRCGTRRRRRPSMRNLLETHRRDRQQRSHALQRGQQYHRPSHQPLPCRWKPSVCSERTRWYQPVWCQLEL